MKLLFSNLFQRNFVPQQSASVNGIGSAF